MKKFSSYFKKDFLRRSRENKLNKVSGGKMADPHFALRCKTKNIVPLSYNTAFR